MGGEGCTIKIDTDLISWFDLDDLIVSKVGVDYEHSLFIMNPSCIQFQEGLKRVNSNESVMKMAKLGVKFRAIAVYILKVGDDVELERYLTTWVPKLSIKRSSKSKVEYKRLTKHGVQMTCTLCKSTTHNKRKCPSIRCKTSLHSSKNQEEEPRKLLLLPWKHQQSSLHIT